MLNLLTLTVLCVSCLKVIGNHIITFKQEWSVKIPVTENKMLGINHNIYIQCTDDRTLDAMYG